jgi:anaerobic ribonucleoside-triphosphate reductase activating protein
VRPALTLRVHALLESGYANGPGCRAVIWVQGCSIRCDGCCNPDAQDPSGGRVVPVTDLVDWARSITGIEGITLSGGEPLLQPAAVAAFLRDIRATTDLSVVLFTGYDWPSIGGTSELQEVVRLTDIVIAGPYRRDQKLERGIRASANQTVRLLTHRYRMVDVKAVPDVEVVLDEQRAVLTGVNDATLT